MATYFNGNSEIQGDHGSLQTLILMNPAYVGYSDTHQQHHHHHQHQPSQGNLVFLNSVAAAAAGNHSLNQHNLSHAPPNPTQQLVGIPLHASSQDPHHPSLHHHQHEISALHGFMPRLQYSTYGAVDPTSAAREVTRAQQGLSLSLSAQTISPGRGGGGGGGDDVRVSGGSSSPGSAVSNGVNGVRNVVLSSKYLKAAQQLLDEVVNVGKGVKNETNKGNNDQSKTAGDSSTVAGEGTGGGETSVKRGGELSTAEKQEIQMRKAKLVSMLDEVEQRYRQYHHQMQIVISWFEQAAGIGAAKTYTALALQTISKQFRCLKDAIAGQIRAASKSLGEDDCFVGGGGKSEGSRLKFVDHQLRQQRALQQLGMMQPNAWRPQRGLPERSVSVLRAWLFEHFLHPYPKDSDKLMLAKQTGLTRSQVSNWFINARVRLWKPMVEEMYLEEIKEKEQNETDEKGIRSENTNEDSTSKIITQHAKNPVIENQHRNFKSKLDIPTNQNSPPVISASTSPSGVNIRNQPGFTLIGSPEIEGIAQASPKKQRNTDILQSPNSYLTNEQISMKFGDERQNRESFSLLGGPTNFIGGFGTYPIGEIGRFSTEQFPATYSGNGVSLTLGLPHCENLSLSGTHQSFLQNQNIQMGRRLEISEPDEFSTINTSTSSHSTAAYESMNIQNRKRFAAQLLPDFVT